MTDIPSYDVQNFYDDILNADILISAELLQFDDKHTKAVEAIRRFWATRTESDYKHAFETQRKLVSVFYGKRFYSG